LRLKRLFWSLPAGVIGTFVFGWKGGTWWAALLGAALAIAAAYFVAGAFVQLGAGSARAVLMPSGRSTPPRHGFSEADAAIMRRRYAEAAALLEAASMEAPDDPEAYLRLARLHRDHLHDPRRAHEWFQHARATRRLTPGERRRVDDETEALRPHLDPDPSSPD
jgi:hypothetical protein